MRQLLLPVKLGDYLLPRRWEIDHGPTGSVTEAEANGRKESTGSSRSFRDKSEIGQELAARACAVGEEGWGRSFNYERPNNPLKDLFLKEFAALHQGRIDPQNSYRHSHIMVKDLLPDRTVTVGNTRWMR